MIKILFICQDRILKSFGEACKINDFMVGYGTHYTTTAPFLQEP